MRHRARLLSAALAWPLGLAIAGCGDLSSDHTAPATGTSGGDSTPAASAPGPAGTEIPDDFPLSSGMGGPQDAIGTARTGTGLRDLTLCDTAPLRGLGVRDRMVADDSGGESADTRELVLLGSAEEAALVAEAFSALSRGCTSPPTRRAVETTTEVRESPFGPPPAATLVQTYSYDGEPGTGATVVHVVPVGAALLVTSTYGGWRGEALEGGVAQTVDAVRETVDALAVFGDGSTPGEEPVSAPDVPGRPR